MTLGWVLTTRLTSSTFAGPLGMPRRRHVAAFTLFFLPYQPLAHGDVDRIAGRCRSPFAAPRFVS